MVGACTKTDMLAPPGLQLPRLAVSKGFLGYCLHGKDEFDVVPGTGCAPACLDERILDLPGCFLRCGRGDIGMLLGTVDGHNEKLVRVVRIAPFNVITMIDP
jgi:hypothetical protein